MALGLQAFAGDWELRREIDDRLAGRVGRLVGMARFEPAPEGLRYVEEGELAWPGTPPMAARQVYLWQADGDGIDVRFSDGRAFHRFVADGVAEARHDCAPDLYLVRYDFTGWPGWRSRWTVRGPRKDYLMVSTYRRT